MIALAIGLTYITNVLADFYIIDKNLAGAIFLGISTALPEIITTLVFVRKKNFNLAISSIVGSVTFNWLILVVGDIFYFSGTVLMQNMSARLLTTALTLSLTSIAVILAVNCFAKNKAKWRWLYCLLAGVNIALYVSYLVLSFIYI